MSTLVAPRSGPRGIPYFNGTIGTQSSQNSRPSLEKGKQALRTQSEQDNPPDNSAYEQAEAALIETWNERLSQITVITTFFAGTEGSLIGMTVPSNRDVVSSIQEAANACLSGALVLHVFAAVISFVAAFFLVRYKLQEAIHHETTGEDVASVPTAGSTKAIIVLNPHLIQVGPWSNRKPPTGLLRRCHHLCMWLAAVGFVLALSGIMCFMWERMPRNASIFSSVCAGVCLITGLCAVLFGSADSSRS